MKNSTAKRQDTIAKQQRKANPTPLCVDLDNTLVNTDTLFETAIAAVKINPFYFFVIPYILFTKGMPYLKSWLCTKTPSFDYSTLPINQKVLSYLEEQRESGRKIYLVTGANRVVGEAVYQKYEHLFDHVYSSSDTLNLIGDNKAEFLLKLFGHGGFDYIGDSGHDLAVWKHAQNALVVGNSYSFIERAKQMTDVSEVFTLEQKPRFKTILRMMRVHQWSKNVLIFFPMVLANAVTVENIIFTVLAFAAFSLCASAIYIVNDLMDLSSDRRHPTKCNRPIARGDVQIFSAAKYFVAILAASFVLAATTLPLGFTVLLSAYLVLTLSYSLKLKHMAIVDVLTLAGLYTMRLYAGAICTGVELSAWLLAFTGFLFLSLSLLKRNSELVMYAASQEKDNSNRAYTSQDLPFVGALGISCGLITVVVFSLYINTDLVKNTYTNPYMLWAICPIMIYAVSKYWMLSSRNQITNDPVLFAIKDKSSYVIILAMAAIWLFARGI